MDISTMNISQHGYGDPAHMAQRRLFRGGARETVPLTGGTHPCGQGAPVKTGPHSRRLQLDPWDPS